MSSEAPARSFAECNGIAASPFAPRLVPTLARPLVIPDVMTLKALADVRELIEKHLPKDRRERSSWRQDWRSCCTRRSTGRALTRFLRSIQLFSNCPHVWYPCRASTLPLDIRPAESPPNAPVGGGLTPATEGSADGFRTVDTDHQQSPAPTLVRLHHAGAGFRHGDRSYQEHVRPRCRDRGFRQRERVAASIAPFAAGDTKAPAVTPKSQSAR
jgi:hypothetical protein